MRANHLIDSIQMMGSPKEGKESWTRQQTVIGSRTIRSKCLGTISLPFCISQVKSLNQQPVGRSDQQFSQAVNGEWVKWWSNMQTYIETSGRGSKSMRERGRNLEQARSEHERENQLLADEIFLFFLAELRSSWKQSNWYITFIEKFLPDYLQSCQSQSESFIRIQILEELLTAQQSMLPRMVESTAASSRKLNESTKTNPNSGSCSQEIHSMLIIGTRSKSSRVLYSTIWQPPPRNHRTIARGNRTTMPTVSGVSLSRRRQTHPNLPEPYNSIRCYPKMRIV